MATHSSISAWKVPWTPSAWDLRELPRVPLRGEGSCGGGGAPRDSAGSGATEEGRFQPSCQVPRLQPFPNLAPCLSGAVDRAWKGLTGSACDAALDMEEAGSHGDAQWTLLDIQIDRLS